MAKIFFCPFCGAELDKGLKEPIIDCLIIIRQLKRMLIPPFYVCPKCLRHLPSANTEEINTYLRAKAAEYDLPLWIP